MIKAFACTNALRFKKKKPPSNSVEALIDSVLDAAPVLQQAWQCTETGEVDWRDVGVVDSEGNSS